VYSMVPADTSIWFIVVLLGSAEPMLRAVCW
jgi:hypothetical protein